MSGQPAMQPIATLARRWQPYPEYRDSDVGWLGEIPAHWEIERLRYVCDLNPSKTEVDGFAKDTEVTFLPMEFISEDGSLVLDETRRIEDVYQGYTYFRNGDVIVAKITPCFENGKGALCQNLANGVGFGTTELHVLRPNEQTISKFIFYLTKSRPFRALGEAMMYGAAGQKRVPEDFIRDFEIALPSPPEQRAIAAFLDRETARIDALIARKERLIELLEEKRAALISHVVTRGLGPTTPMKDSGIPAIGQIPSHWRVRRNKTIFEEVNEKSTTGTEELLTVSHITGVTPRTEKEVNMFLAESMEGYKLCSKNDLVINTMWAWMGALGVTRYEGIVSPSYNVYRLKEGGEYVPRYLDFLYRTPPYICEITRYSKGVWLSRLRLYPASFFEIHTLTPPFSEQRQIVEFISEGLQPIDRFVDKLKNSIEKLQEYRTALISAAVTGKIDVREAGP